MASIQNHAYYPISSGSTHTLPLTLGEGTNRKVVLAVVRETANTVTGVAYDGVSFLANERVAVAGTQSGQMWEYDVPDEKAAGAYNLVFTSSASTTAMSAEAWQAEGCVAGAPEDVGSHALSGLVATITTLTCTDGALVFAAAISGAGTAAPNTYAYSGGTVSEIQESAQANWIAAYAEGTASGAGDKTVTATATFNTTQVLVAMSVAAITGPTIDTQPTAQVAVVNPSLPATFTTAATTSGGTLVYDGEFETSVGGGSYANLADGSGLAWTGQTAASATATPSTAAASGRRYRNNVSDDNGTTTTNAVALTVYEGWPVTDDSTTSDGSGQTTGEAVTDIVGEDVPEAAFVLMGLYQNGVLLTPATFLIHGQTP